MRLIQNAMVLVFSAVLLPACASVQEKQVLSDWNVENQRFIVADSEMTALPELADNPTLEDYILYALLNNPGLRASFDRWKAALEKVTPARALPDPRLTYANYINEVETRVGAQEQKFGLSQTFPWFGKLDLQENMALQSAQAEHQRYEAAKLNLIYQVKKIYYEYSYLARAIQITKDNVTLLSQFERVARSKYKGGSGLQSAVIKTQVELGTLEDRLQSRQDFIRPIVARLNMALNRPSHLLLPLPKAVPDIKHDLDGQALISLLRKKNPELKALEFMAAKEEWAAKLATKKYYPDVTLGMEYIDTASRSDINVNDNGKDPVIAMVSVNLPIWHQKYNALKNEAATRRRAIMRDRTEKENMLIADLEMALYQLRDTDRKITLYGDTLMTKAEQNVRVTQQAFSSDKASFLDLIDSQRILLRFQLEYERANADRAQRLAEIEMLTGGNPNLTQSHRDTKEINSDH